MSTPHLETPASTSLAETTGSSEAPASDALVQNDNVQAAENTAEDQFLWLEELDSDRAMDWVVGQNDRTEAELFDADFAATKDAILTVLDAADRIPMVTKRGEHYYNFWRDSQHPKGLWRRTSWESYLQQEPEWEVLLDVDALAAAEGIDWVYSGAQMLRPASGREYTRALVKLSPDGGDQVRVREFDLPTLAFVPGGFDLPVAKTNVSWADADTLFVATDVGEGSLTLSSYARTVRRLSRGHELAEAEEIFAVDQSHVLAYVSHDSTPGFERDVAHDVIDFYNSKTYVRSGDEWVHLDVPTDVGVSLHRGWVIFSPQTPWTREGVTHIPGSLVLAELDGFMAGTGALREIFVPTDSTSLQSIDFTASHILLNVLQDVSSQILICDPARGFELRPLDIGSPLHSFSISAVDDEDPECGEDFWLSLTGFLTPTTLARGTVGSDAANAATPLPVKSAPARFDAEDFEVSQHFAVSDDGTRVPYFQVSPRELPLDGKNPVLMNGYGGFQASLTPSYLGALGPGWLVRRTEQGRRGSYVVANIRGGGEYGPRWHRAALRENRHRAYEDFAAIARDLINRGVTSREHLAATGRSNGGLLMGNMITGYPELFGAISCGVPLLDMRRYTRLAAGHSWIAEYGDPDVPADWEFVRTFSPYHRLDDALPKGATYPASLIWSATSDDRVGPVQARKMAAKMLDMGVGNVRYHESLDGGHAGASDNGATATMLATSYEFLWRHVAD
ncbi:prolyl oligopeptidase family serine peptidase [Paeniglutamicibacter psychrophenolicus]|uniref:Prolyl oligopeptidase n=1 Tax=Paeniglutamicibacter psychrophenolicus TaxID=257454 RepID=A0ABS4W7X9_9MICC|nr:prolyl oligopeptidase family serine peptidase [Paeniglutamicibacter psychrophenolicus]MBP2372131.1 prolyl oligopeptidase [Paeniglutamicibacter psychrophenolicus]